MRGFSLQGKKMPSSLILPRFTQVDAYGNPLVGGRLYTYANMTTTPQITYKDAAGTIANTNPIILDSLGSAVVFLKEGLVYTFVMKDANDALIWSQDSISGSQTASGGIAVVTSLPTSDIGPVYLAPGGIYSWNGTQYVSGFSQGFGSGPFSNKNKMQNGGYRVWQRGTTVGPSTSTPAAGAYTADGWKIVATAAGSFTVTQQVAGSDYAQNRVGGFTARVTSNAAVTPAAGDKNRFIQPIEGQNVISLGLGSVYGGFFTHSFWVKASIVGTYSVAYMNGGTPSFRSYVANFTVNTAGAWEKKTIVVPVDTSGTANWNRSNGIGLQVVFDLGSGSGSEGAINTWLSTETTRSVGSVRIASTSGATLEFGQQQIEQGATATPFEERSIDAEILMSRRYYRLETYQTNDSFDAATPAGGGVRKSYYIGEPMRIASPTTGIDAVNWEAFIGGAWLTMLVSGLFVSSGIFVQIVWVAPVGTPASGTMLVRSTAPARVILSAEM